MKVLKNILFWISTVCLVLAIATIAVPKLFGMEFRAVVSGSMTPEIPVGSLVVIVPTEAEDIKIGDDITFVNASELVVTHRVIDINRETNEFTTWGIANDSSAIDAPNKYENIIGVVKLHIPFVGRIFSWFSTMQGKIITATAIIATFLLSTILSIWSKDREGEIEIPAGNTKDNAPDQGKRRFDDLLDSFAESEALFNEFRLTEESQNGNAAALTENGNAVALTENDELFSSFVRSVDPPEQNLYSADPLEKLQNEFNPFPASDDLSNKPVQAAGLTDNEPQTDDPLMDLILNDDSFREMFEKDDLLKDLLND